MPRAFLVKKSSLITFGHSRNHEERKPSTPVDHKYQELPWEPLDMSEHEHDLQTAKNVGRELDFHGCFIHPSSPRRENQDHLKDGSQVFDKKRHTPVLVTERTRSLASMFLLHSLKSKTSNEMFKNDFFEDEILENPFECRDCDVVFKRPSDLQRHALSHEVKKPCEPENRVKERNASGANVDKPFDRPEELQRNLLIHGTEKPFKCQERDSRVKLSSEERKSREKPFDCTLCIMTFNRPSDLARHNSLIHDINKPYQCEQDDMRGNLSNEGNMMEKPFKCSHCIMSFTRPSDLQRHSLIHRSNKPYKCEKCDRQFTWFGNFQKHILSHMSENSKFPGSYSTMFDLLAREQAKDLFIKEGDKYRCLLCSKDFTRLSGLRTHVRMHTGERPYVCEVCSFAFTTSRALKMHTRLHTGEKPYKCDVCDRAFTRRDEMHTHMYIHKGEKPFKCTQCSSSFIRYGHLQRHLLIHSEDKPYKCKLCPKSFTQYRNLQTHTYKHTGERPYRCTFCPKGFTQYGTLQAHERTHTGEKPFKCQLCERAFITSSHLRWHIKTQHPKKSTE